MNVCFLCSEYPPGPHGGIGTMTRLIGRELVKKGHGVRTIGIYPKTFPAPDFEVDNGVEVTRLRRSSVRLGWVYDRFRLFKRVRAWAENDEIDIVEAPDYEGLVAFWPTLPVPVVVRCNGSITYFAHILDRPLNRAERLLERAALRRADAYASVSRYTAETTRRLFTLNGRPFATLYNPVDVPAEKPPFDRRSSSDVVFTGSLTEKKGIVSLIDAWPHIRSVVSDASLHVYGKDLTSPSGNSMTAFLHQRLPSAHRDSVVFHGHVDREELYSAFATAAAAVFPSYAEAFSLAPLESMSMACPTVHTTRVSGPEMLKDGESGLLVDPASPAEIANAVIRLLTNRRLARRLAENGRRRVETNFSISRAVLENEAFFAGAIERFRA